MPMDDTTHDAAEAAAEFDGLAEECDPPMSRSRSSLSPITKHTFIRPDGLCVDVERCRSWSRPDGTGWRRLPAWYTTEAGDTWERAVRAFGTLVATRTRRSRRS